MSVDAGLHRGEPPMTTAPVAAPLAESSPPIRLVLDLRPDGEAALRKLPALASSSVRPVARKVERSYWDTPTSDLAKGGYALGLRRSGTRTYQRMLAIGTRRTGGGTVHDVEVTVTGARPDLVKLALQPGAPARQLGLIAPESLVPVFATDLKRTQWRIDWRGTKLSLGLETGTLVSPAGEQPVCQLTLDLEEGPAAGLYDFARMAWATLPLSLAAFDAVQSGYRLAAQADWWHDPKPKLTMEMTTRDGILAIGRASLATLRAEMTRLAGDLSAENIHQSRVAIRRLRSVLTVFQQALPEAARRSYAKALGSLASQLGKTREWDVFLAETVAPIAAAMPDETSLGGLRLSAAVLRENAAKDLARRLEATDFAILSLMLGSWFDAGIWPMATAEPEPAAATSAYWLDQPLGTFAREVLRKRHRKVVSTAEALDDPRPAALHVLRLHAKKLRYTAEAFAPLFPAKSSKPYIAALREVQEVLGVINDAATAPALIDRLKSSRNVTEFTAGILAGWAAAHTETARNRFADAWQDLIKAKRFWKAD